ncbi:MAG: hypothetical protein K6E73_03035 [Bacteroidales bacterium]|nr:hypothetical protein [Bacteroidales bacterium]
MKKAVYNYGVDKAFGLLHKGPVKAMSNNKAVKEARLNSNNTLSPKELDQVRADNKQLNKDIPKINQKSERINKAIDAGSNYLWSTGTKILKANEQKK